MFVRTVYVTGDPAKVEAAIRSLNSQGRELLEERPDYRGADVVVDRELGKLVAVSWWGSEEARRNSDQVMRERRRPMLEPFAGTVAVDNYEVALFHAVQPPRSGGGMRSTRVEFDPADTDLFADTFRASAIPRLEALPGFARCSVFVDRRRGRGVVGSLFVDRASMVASRAGQASARRADAAKARVTVVGLEEFEVVHADVRPD
ncbi:hypothetical protein [Streptomyces fuscichromogenes]|uniref:ABM domain-containing protein n=1 Tax=Streptomyces fuscichromogenes TaxID=1324013 RepID=A0A917XIS1_9ACTN|nr:hypothetical protein [Streptomyces fuscichromogenes]GGN30279.1 hypothetical protein GCM10011578_067240 [Streptomyces fuscichromogenes]